MICRNNVPRQENGIYNKVNTQCYPVVYIINLHNYLLIFALEETDQFCGATRQHPLICDFHALLACIICLVDNYRYTFCWK